MDHHHTHQNPSLFKEEENRVERGETEEESNNNKSCTACNTTKTPLWRTGPSGPKSLCNACGIRYRKKRGTQVGPDGIISPIKDGKRAHYTDDTNGSRSMRVRFVVMGKRVTLQRPRPKPSPPPSPTSCLSSSSSLSCPPPVVVVVVKKQRCQTRKRKLRMEEEDVGDGGGWRRKLRTQVESRVERSWNRPIIVVSWGRLS